MNANAIDLTNTDSNDIIDLTNIDLINEFESNILVKPKNKTPKRTKKIIENKLEITFENYYKHNLLLSNYKLPELKETARKCKINISGTKQALIERIEKEFDKIKKAQIIQKIFRGSIVRNSFKLRGPAFKNRSICNNDNDFVTMEPLNEIPDEYFYSYTDKQQFTYGFNIVSLVQMLKSKGKLVNPYNREKLTPEIIRNISSLYTINCILYPYFKEENKILNIYTSNNCQTIRNSIISNQNNYTSSDNHQHNRSSILTNNYRPTINYSSLINPQDIERYNKIREIQARPIHQRINDLFIEFDNLGNYTQSSWFNSLELRDYAHLYTSLYDIWNYRANLSREVRLRICPFYGPFDGIFARPVNHQDLNIEQLKLACLIVLETMTYSGINEENRILGAFHALTALTIVSSGARNAMPYLYQAVRY
jgi:hypothetical protein